MRVELTKLLPRGVAIVDVTFWGVAVIGLSLTGKVEADVFAPHFLERNVLVVGG